MHRWFTSGLSRLFDAPVRYAMIGDWTNAQMDAIPVDRRISCMASALEQAVRHCLENGADSCSSIAKETILLIGQCRRVSGLDASGADSSDGGLLAELGMLRTVLEQFDEIARSHAEQRSAGRFSIDKTRLGELVEFLSVFEEALLELMDSTRPTLNLVLPWLHRLYAYCESIEADSRFVAFLKRTMEVSMAVKVNPKLRQMHFVAAYFDYRLKNEQFAFVGNSLRAPAAKEFVRDLYEQLRPAIGQPEASDSFAPDPFLPTDFKVERCEISRYETECNRLEAMYEQGQFDVLRYWSDQREQLPVLSTIASWVLSVPASSIMSGRTSLAADA